MDDKKILSMDDILAVEDTEYKEIEMWGGVARIGSLTAGELLEFVEANKGPAKTTAGLRLIIKSLVNKDGNRIGKDTHLQGLRTRNAKQIEDLTNKILVLNGIGKKAQEEAKND